MDVRTSQVIQTVPSQGHVPHQLISLFLVQMEDKTRPSWIMVIQFTSHSWLSMELGTDPRPTLPI